MCQRRGAGYIRRRKLRMESLGRWERRKSKRRFMDTFREDMQVASVTEEDSEDRLRWRTGEPLL